MAAVRRSSTPLAGSPNSRQPGGWIRRSSPRNGSGTSSTSPKFLMSISSSAHRVSNAHPTFCSGRARTPNWSSSTGFGRTSIAGTCGARSSSTRIETDATAALSRMPSADSGVTHLEPRRHTSSPKQPAQSAPTGLKVGYPRAGLAGPERFHRHRCSVLVVVVGVLSVPMTLMNEVGVVTMLHVRMAAAGPMLMWVDPGIDVRQYDVVVVDRLRKLKCRLVTAPQQRRGGQREDENENRQHDDQRTRCGVGVIRACRTTHRHEDAHHHRAPEGGVEAS